MRPLALASTVTPPILAVFSPPAATGAGPPAWDTDKPKTIRAATEALTAAHLALWAITLFPRGFDQVIPQVLALFLFYFPLVLPVGTTRPGLLFGR